MLAWSDCFKTDIELVDEQHQGLFVTLNKLTDSFESGMPSEETVMQTLQELMDYANKHLNDEEVMMQEHHLDERHVSIHKMEHCSFRYDLEHVQLHSSADEDEVQTAERIVRFITSWLVYHILGVDMVMAAQVHAMEQGMSPEQAYETHKKIERDNATMQLILKATLELWHTATEHCRILEEKLAALGGQSSQNSLPLAAP